MQNSESLPKNWQKVSLDETLSLIIDHRGITPKKLGGHWSSSGIPALSAKNIKDGRIVNESDIRYVDDKLYEKWMPEKLRCGDILLTSEAPLGELLYLKDKVDYCLSQRLFALRTDEDKLYSRFFYYYLLSPVGRHELMRRISGTAAEGIRQEELRQIEVYCPEDIKEQKNIASILSAFDDKIEVNNKINQALEQMTQAIFKEWFVDFRFPGYEKAEFVESDLGRIPKGWLAKRLGEITEFNKGLSYSSSEISDNPPGVPLVNLKCFLRGGGFKFDGLKYYKGGYRTKHEVKPGQLVIALTDLTPTQEVVGRPATIPKIRGAEKILISLDVCSLQIKEGKDWMNGFIYYLLRRRDFGESMANSATGTTVAHLNQSVIENYAFILPEEAIIRSFYQFVSSMFDKFNFTINENQALSSLRDLLLPKLTSGEIRVKV